MSDVKLKQVRSANGSNRKQLETLQSLNLGRIGRESTMADTPQQRGKHSKVEHLVEVEGK